MTAGHARRERRDGSILILILVALASLAVASAAPPAATAATTDPAARIERILHNRHMDGPGTAVYVWDLETGRQVYAQNITTPLHPASNLKLVTTAAALQAWGDDHRIATQVLASAPPSAGGVLHGDLYLYGLGDPSFSTREYQRDVLDLRTASVEAVARRLRKLGLRHIRGAVVGDASWFDDRSAVASWRPGEQDECGRLSALTVDESLRNGNRVDGPALYAARLLTRALRKDGVAVDDAPRVGITPAGPYLLLQQRSAPLSELLQHMDQDSDNFFAEMFVKGLGRDLYGQGTTDAGLQALRAVLAQLGADPASYRIADGSGLSYEDRLTAAEIVGLLTAMYRRDDFDVFYDALSVAGVDGTLEDRMRDTPAQGNAHAKTGTLDVAASLSGYVTSADGHLLVFSMLDNGDLVDWWDATRAQDAVVAALAGSRLGGEPRLRDTPQERQHVLDAAEATFVPGRAFVPCPEVPAS